MSHPGNSPAVIYANGAVSRNQATDELVATYPYQTADEVEAVLQANAAALSGLARHADEREGRGLPQAHRDAVGPRKRWTIITAETGKTIAGARAEVEKTPATVD